MQPVLTCDPVGAETHTSDFKAGVDNTVSCRLYSHLPFQLDQMKQMFPARGPGAAKHPATVRQSTAQRQQRNARA